MLTTDEALQGTYHQGVDDAGCGLHLAGNIWLMVEPGLKARRCDLFIDATSYRSLAIGKR